MSSRLFVVDANLAVQKLVEYSLSREGFEVTAFSDGLSALDASDRIKPDVLIVEYNVAGMNISKFCEKIRKDPDLKDCSILLLVNPSDTFDEKSLLSAGITDFIRKPIESADLATKAKQYLTAKNEDEEVEVSEEEMVKMEELLGWSSSAGSKSFFSELKEDDTPGLLDLNESVKDKEETAKEADNLVFVDEKEASEVREEKEEKPVEREPVPKIETVTEKILPKAEVVSGATSQIPGELVEKMVKEAAREAVERIAWEVIPSLAEIAIKKELEKLKDEDK
ncbi:MAG: response regulator [Nitrospirota bacterium]